jgi:signal transduction histidine kinase
MMTPPEASVRHPLARMPRISRPARRALDDLAAIVSGGVVAVLAMPLLALAALGLSLPPLSAFFFADVASAVRETANRARRRAERRLGQPVPEPYRPLTGSRWMQVRIIVGDPATWRDLGWLAAQAVIGCNLAVLGLALWAGFLAAPFLPLIRALVPAREKFSYALIPVMNMPLAVASVPAGLLLYGACAWWGCRWMASGQARMAAWLLAPTERARLTAQVTRLAATRADTVDARAAELRRIERDLHDGTQARLVSLAMSLGMAEEEIIEHPETARKLVAEARDSASKALAELRDIVRGIHPPVLADRGLAGGIEALALSSQVPVDVIIELPGRLPPPLESALYFATAEALTNVARHSHARWAFVRLWKDEQARLHLLVHDDGTGGADPEGGTGLRGIERRIAAFDGHLTLTSPAGGPTELALELPCPP